MRAPEIYRAVIMALKKPVGVNVSLVVDNPEKTAHFWEETFGAKIVHMMKAPDGTVVRAGLKFGETFVMFTPAEPAPPGFNPSEWSRWTSKPRANGVTIYVNVRNVKPYWETAQKNGATITQPLMDQFWGDRNFTTIDNNGYVVTFAERVKKVTPKQMEKALAAMTPSSGLER
jgi:PhnB protein